MAMIHTGVVMPSGVAVRWRKIVTIRAIPRILLDAPSR
jgi:hypothetical protein